MSVMEQDLFVCFVGRGTHFHATNADTSPIRPVCGSGRKTSETRLARDTFGGRIDAWEPDEVDCPKCRYLMGLDD